MIKDGKMFLDLPEDWKKIIKILREGPAFREDILRRSGLDEKKFLHILRTMDLLLMIGMDNKGKIMLRDKK